ncbi:MAG: hypothetical protein AB7N71_00665 [Phycisphaerae bacterium]
MGNSCNRFKYELFLLSSAGINRQILIISESRRTIAQQNLGILTQVRMAQKSWKVKIVTEDFTEALLEALLSRWNVAVASIIKTLMALRRGEYGDRGKAIWEHVAKAKNNYHVIYGLTQPVRPSSKTDKSAATKKAAELTQEFVNKFGHLEELVTARTSAGALWKEAIHAATQRIKSYQELHEQWKHDHEQWKKEKVEWEEAHENYMKIRPLVEDFHAQSGATRGRRERWNKWIDFLANTAEIIKWRNGDAIYKPPPPEKLAKIRSRRRNVVRAERDLIFDLNPELQRFDQLHGAYERRFVRAYAKRRHHDGFRHRPSFTIPSSGSRPDWPRFQQKAGWKNLDLDNQKFQILIPNCDATKNRWLSLSFVPDPRFRRLLPAEAPEKYGATSYHYHLKTQHAGQLPAQPQGVKLLQRNGSWFATFSLDIIPPACGVPIKQAHITKYSANWTRKKIEEEVENASDTLTTCAIDLAIRHLGAVTVKRGDRFIARRILSHRFDLNGENSTINIPTLPQIAQVQRQLRSKRRRAGKMPPGKPTASRLQAHYRNLQDDRVKKAAFAIFEIARVNGAQIIVLENLRSLTFDTAREKGVNAALMRWNRGALVTRLFHEAEFQGMRVIEVPAYYTSRVCAQCDAIGVRFDTGTPRRRDEKAAALLGKSRDALRNAPRLNYLGHWFYCPACRRRVHADINASENLHRVFWQRFPEVQSTKEAERVTGWIVGRDGSEISYRREKLETDARNQLGISDVSSPPF